MRSFLPIACLIGSFSVVDVACAQWTKNFPFLQPAPEFIFLCALGTVLAQPVVLGVWLALGRSSAWLRISTTALGVLLCAWAISRDYRQDWEINLQILILTAVIVFVVLLPQRWLGLQLQRIGELDESSAMSHRWQFPLIGIIQLTTAAALAAAAFRKTDVLLEGIGVVARFWGYGAVVGGSLLHVVLWRGNIAVRAALLTVGVALGALLLWDKIFMHRDQLLNFGSASAATLVLCFLAARVWLLCHLEASP